MSELEHRLRDYGQQIDRHTPAVGLIDLEQRLADKATSFEPVVGLEPSGSRLPTWQRGVAVGVAASVLVLVFGFGLPFLLGGTSEPSSSASAPASTAIEPVDSLVPQEFMAAWAARDGTATADLFDSSGTYGAGLFSPRMFPLLHDWYRAVGWDFEDKGCAAERVEVSSDQIYAECEFTSQNELARAVGWPRVSDSFRLVVDGGRIDLATERYGFDAYRDLWFEFKDWVAANHARDLDRMFIYPTQPWPGVRNVTMDPPFEALNAFPLLNETSVTLWTKYVNEFIATPEAVEEAMQNLEAARYVAETVETCKAADIEFEAEVDGLMQKETSNFQQFSSGFTDLQAVAQWHEARSRHADAVIAGLRDVPAPAAIADDFDRLLQLMTAENDLIRQVEKAAEAGDQQLVDTLIGKRIDATHAKDDLAFHIGYAMWACPVWSGGS